MFCPRGFAAGAGNSLISDGQALASFTAAGLAYQAEDYDKAISAYEDILRAGKESGALYYNLGNSYFKKGRLGKAILNYQRAGRLIPREGDLIFNLEYARKLVEQRIRKVDSDVPPEAEVGVPTPDAFGRDVGIEQGIRNWTDRELAWAFCCLALVLAATHLVSLYGQWPPRWRRPAIGVLCVLILICSGGFVVKLAAQTDRAVAITAGDAKFEPRADATTYFPLGEGTLLKIIKTENDWAKIQCSDGTTGWVPQKVFERF